MAQKEACRPSQILNSTYFYGLVEIYISDKWPFHWSFKIFILGQIRLLFHINFALFMYLTTSSRLPRIFEQFQGFFFKYINFLEDQIKSI